MSSETEGRPAGKGKEKGVGAQSYTGLPRCMVPPGPRQMRSTSVTLLLKPGWKVHPGVVSGSAMYACGVGRGYHPVKHDADSMEPKFAVLAEFPEIVASL